MVFTDLLKINGLLEFLNSPIKEVSTFEYLTILISVFIFGYVVGIIKKRRF